MPIRLVALDEGSDIVIDRAMVMVGRHPQCDARLESIRVSRRHCCMMKDQHTEDVIVRDLGSTNGIRINGQRIEKGTLRPGDELSIAHLRYRMEVGHSEELTLAETIPADHQARDAAAEPPSSSPFVAPAVATPGENPLAAAVREMLPASVADRCRIQVIVQMPAENGNLAEIDVPLDSQPSEPDASCPPDSSPSSPG
ncbi:FHA domain-containing protein [Tautonia marina]|uniref:FHA domain-containing protein n=1 Tax=Tautonia marina TaxID=2653855 RepID=UPI0012606BA3|nr:FHA domain-containing protein [Tautonia marina]